MKFSNLEGSVSEGSGSPLHDESHYGLYQHLSYFSASVVVLPCLGHIFVDTSEDFSQDLTATASPPICYIVTLFFYLELEALGTTV